MVNDNSSLHQFNLNLDVCM